LVPSDPHGVSTPTGHSRGRSSRAGLRRTGAPLALSRPFRGPSPHPRTVPLVRRPARRTMLPLLGFPALRRMPERRTRDSAGRPAPRRAASEVSIPPSRRPPPSLPRLAARSVHRLHPSRRSPRSDGYPSRDPCPRAVLRVGSPRPHGERADASGFRASFPDRARAASASPKGSGASMPSWVSPVQSIPSPRPGVPLWVAEPPLARVRTA